MNIENLKMTTRLRLGFGMLPGLLVILVIAALNSVASINSGLNNVVDSSNVKLDAVTYMRDATRRVAIATGNIVALGVASAWLVTRSMTRPIEAAIKIPTVALGDFTSRIEVDSTDETGQLMQALKDMNDSLINIVGQVRTSIDTIATASSEIASGILDLSSRPEEQASSIEETASSMKELTSTVKRNADNARQANQLAISASEVGTKGGVVFNQEIRPSLSTTGNSSDTHRSADSHGQSNCA